MNLFFKFLGTCAFLSFTYAVNAKPLPAILCVDANALWDGPYTVEIDSLETEQIIASVFDQSDTGRFLIAEEKVNAESKNKTFVLSNSNFKLEMDTQEKTEPNNATITFTYESNVIYGIYSCIFL